MAPASNDTRCRQSLLFSLDEAFSAFTPRSYSIVAKHKALKRFFSRLSQEQHEIMRPYLKKLLKDLPSPTKELENIVGRKRPAEDIEISRQAKKVKLEKTRRFVKQTFNCERRGKVRSFSTLALLCR